MKKVLFVINTLGRAGAEKSMTELMKVMDTNKYELHLLVLVNRGEMYDEVPPYVIMHNKHPDNRSVLSIGARFVLIKTVIVALLKKINFLRELPYLFHNIKEQLSNGRIQLDKLFWKIISDGTPVIQEKFDIAIAYLEGGAAYYVADYVKADKKAVFIHIDYKKAGYTPTIDHGCYDKMNRIYIVSEDAKKSFVGVYPQYKDKVEIFYNIINAEAIKKLAEEGTGFQDDFDGIRILTIGRLHYQKAYDMAIPVLQKIRKAGYNIRWYVIGDGAIRGELEKLIEKHNVTGDFILLGAKSNPYPFLKQCQLYVHTTRFEGKSIAIEEAQVLGKAIVASDCTGNREQIQHEVNGIIVDLEVNEIASEIIKLLDDKTLIYKFEQANAEMKFDYRKNLDLLYSFMEDNG
ncbi:MAG: glycosyltransferase [Eubacteriaceae bacterium]